MNVMLDLTKEEMEAALKSMKEAEDIARQWLATIRTNIYNLEKALAPPPPVFYQNILSETYPDTAYLVCRTGDTYTCECKSFVYARSLDEHHRCKHIRTAINRPYSWRQ